ncbi:glycoside hydrolase superfamily [Cunninghamella echinulata]|nr:glycoside hydrolase superfamily [Cunninghamella echinulata]
MVTENIYEPVLIDNPIENVKSTITEFDSNTATTTITTTVESDPVLSNTINVNTVDNTSAQYWGSPIYHHGRWFKDGMGRTLLIRGINVCGSSKLPTHPYKGSTHLYDESFWDHTNVSFVNRPFPLEEAHIHFSRLQAWGFTFIRLLVPWEALEHRRGEYDETYIDYLRNLITIMGEYGIKCLIDPHQDTWSRFSGGSGAPGWTFEIAGLDIKSFKETGAAYVHNTNAVPGDPLPMVWPTNYTKLACCTMFTLFWGGDTFAPKHTYEGQSIQQLLQSHFINAFKHLATRLEDLDPVVGFEVINEPSPGYIGLPTLKAFDPVVNLIFGDAPTPLQSFALGDGIPQKVGVYIKSWPFPTKKSHSRVINENKVSAWLNGGSCVWKQHGVWDIKNEKPILLASDYFSKDPKTGKKVDFYQDFYVPFVNKYATSIQEVKKSWYCFVEPMANEKSPIFTKDDHQHNLVYAPHWYDLNCLFYKKFNSRMTHDVQQLQNGGNVISATYFGQKGVKKNYAGQIKNIKQSGLDNIGQVPTLFGEVGIPMDINDRYAFKTGDYSQQTQFLDAVIYALESSLVSFTLWNYDVSNDDEYGDHWNGENFSLYSSKNKRLLNDSANMVSLNGDQLNEGGRVLAAALRPYASKIAGTPKVSNFDMDKLLYTLVFLPFNEKELEEQQKLGWEINHAKATQTEIYIPNYQYQQVELDIQVNYGQCKYIPEKQTIYHEYDRNDIPNDQPIVVKILPQKNSANKQIQCMIM